MLNQLSWRKLFLPLEAFTRNKHLSREILDLRYVRAIIVPRTRLIYQPDIGYQTHAAWYGAIWELLQYQSGRRVHDRLVGKLIVCAHKHTTMHYIIPQLQDSVQGLVWVVWVAMYYRPGWGIYRNMGITHIMCISAISAQRFARWHFNPPRLVPPMDRPFPNALSVLDTRRSGCPHRIWRPVDLPFSPNSARYSLPPRFRKIGP